MKLTSGATSIFNPCGTTHVYADTGESKSAKMQFFFFEVKKTQRSFQTDSALNHEF